MKRWPLESEREFWRDACAPHSGPRALYWFVRVAWGAEAYFRGTGEANWLTRRIHVPYLDWLGKHILDWKAERRAGKAIRRVLLVLLPRGFGKTVSTTKAALLWSHLDERNMTSYIGSETHRKAKSFLAPIKSIMAGEDEFAWFTWLYGNWYAPDRVWNDTEVKHQYRTAMGFTEPSIGTYGVDTGITGMHPLLVFFDDPTSLETMTPLSLAAARDSYDATFPALRNDSLFIGVMTRYAENDVAGHMIAQEAVAEWQGLAPPEERFTPSEAGKIGVYFLQGRDGSKRTPEHMKGEPVLPEVWNEENLLRYEKRDPVNYAAQIQNTPTMGEHMPLEAQQIDRMWVSRHEVPPIAYATVHLDCAFKEEERLIKGDYNAIVGCLHSYNGDGRVFLDRAYREKNLRAETFVTMLIRYISSLEMRGYHVRTITDEPEGAGKRGTFKLYLQAAIGSTLGHCPNIILVNRTGRNKDRRLREAATMWAEGHFRLIKGAEGAERLKHEMLLLTKADHEDLADACADCFHPECWTKPRTAPALGGADIRQPGDDYIKSPPVVLNRDALNERVAELAAWGRVPKDYLQDPDEDPWRDDPV